MVGVKRFCSAAKLHGRNNRLFFLLGKNVLSNAKHFHCSFHATWLPCKTSIGWSILSTGKPVHLMDSQININPIQINLRRKGWILLGYSRCTSNLKPLRILLVCMACADQCSVEFRPHCAVPENIHTPPAEGIGISWALGGFYETKKIKEMYEALLKFPEGWGGVRKNSFRGGGMDSFWKTTH